MWIALIYLAVVSLIAMIVTVHDKRVAEKQKRRVRERTLFIWSALGGSVAMYLTMLAIRHKTLHKRFMIGIPLIFVLQVVLVYLLFHFGIITI